MSRWLVIKKILLFPNTYFSPLLTLLLLLVPLLVLQRSLHREAQAIFLIVTRRRDVSLVLFSLLFFPGVLLHEASHYLTAVVLGVHTGGFSLIPRPLPDGRLQLGYVETAKSDWLRDALIGAAPLLAGGAFVAYAGLAQLGLLAVWQGWLAGGPPGDLAARLQGALAALPQVYARPDFWLWFYLIFAVSSTMFPSASDRRAWLPLGVIASLLLATVLFAGAGPWLIENLAAPLNRILRAVAVVLAISAAIHLLLVLPLWAIRRVLSRITGLQIA
jgi:hypothetical protein